MEAARDDDARCQAPPRLPLMMLGVFVDPMAVNLDIDCPASENPAWCYTIDGDDGYPTVRSKGAIR